MKIALPAYVRPQLEGRLPADVEPAWYAGGPEALAAVADAEAGWLDVLGPPGIGAVLDAGPKLKWVATAFAGVTGWPLDKFAARGLVLTNGAGINAIPVAEFTVMGVLAMAKNVRELIYHQDRKEWVARAPGVGELYESKALIIGYGHIGRLIAERLAAFGVEVVGVRRNPAGEPGVLGPDGWRPRLGEFDWVIIAAPGTAETEKLIGAAELAAMKPSAFLVNIARGTLVDQPALIEAVTAGSIAGAFLDVTDPEPAAADDPIWSTPNIVMTCHTSGRAQTRMPERAAALFLENLERYRAGQPLKNRVDLAVGY